MTLPVAFARAFARRFTDLLGQPIQVALSGGSDSVALLALLAGTENRLGCAVLATHVHHHLRGADADADAEHCARLCASFGVPLTIVHIDPTPPRGTSPEAWWRSERYRLLEQVRARTECTATATAHTVDDQAETVLLKLLRGAGPRGVAGVRSRHGAVIRPLLGFGRQVLRAWLREQGLEWSEDASNLTGDRPRTWLRRDVMPLLTAVYPRATEQLAAFAAALGEDEAFFAASLAAAAWPDVGRPARTEAIAALPAALQRRWVLALADRLPLAEPPSRAQLEAVESMLTSGQPAAVDLGRRWLLRRRGELLHLSPPPYPRFAPVVAEIGTRTSLPAGFEARLGTPPVPTARYAGFVAARASHLALVWRPVRPGERWPPGGKRPLAKVLAVAGVPAEWRRAWPLLEAGGTILWVPAVGPRPGWSGDERSGIRVELEVPWIIRGR